MSASPSLRTQRIASCLTPPGRSAIATIRASGFDSLEEFDPFFQSVAGKTISAYGYGKIVFGHWKNLQGQTEELVVVPINDSEIQIHCHGGTAPIEAILESLESIDFQTVRSEIDRPRSNPNLQNEIQHGLLNARSRKIADRFLNLNQGGLERTIQNIVQSIQLNKQILLLTELADSFPVGQFLIRPIQVVLAGAPNVGKSSLNNNILGYSRSIVFDQPGTTRDVVSEPTVIDGWQFEFSDTAGLRHSEDKIEAAGVEFAMDRVETADVVVRVISAEYGIENLKQELAVCPNELDNVKHRMLPTVNKMDLLTTAELADLQAEFSSVVFTDAKNGVGIERLLQKIKQQAIPAEPPLEAPLLFTERQSLLVKQAIVAIKSGNEQDSRNKLSQILTG